MSLRDPLQQNLLPPDQQSRKNSKNSEIRGPTDFYFGISQIAKFFGKSPATLRKWEADGFYDFPRNENNERTLEATQVRELTWKAYKAGRIDATRRHMIDAIMTMFELLQVME